jgi:hypothetical protein
VGEEKETEKIDSILTVKINRWTVLDRRIAMRHERSIRPIKTAKKQNTINKLLKEPNQTKPNLDCQ